MIEKKARNYYHSLVANNTDVFDKEFFNEENIEWACLILDSRLIYVDYEAFLIPMLDFANYKEYSENPSRVFRAKFNSEYTTTQIKTMQEVGANSEIFENLGYSNDNYLLYHGFVLPENSHDCYSVTLSFSERQDDNLKEQRKAFFSKYFLFDKTNSDEIAECVSLKNPFPRRFMFFYYTLLLDEIDMEKPDPKRVGLENDRIVLEHVKNALYNLQDMYSSKSESDQERANREPELYKKNVIQYLVEQKNYLAKLIEVYHVQANKMNKDDML